MTRQSFFALACLTTALVTAPAVAGETVVLRENPSAEGSHITLGDLFTSAGASADVVVARAPAPGSRTSLDVSYVQHIAAEHDLDWANAAGVRRVTVARASRTVDADMLTDMLEGELFAREGSVHDVQLANSGLVLHAPVESVGGPQIVSLNYDIRSGLLSAEVAPYDGADTVRLTGRAYATVDVPVLARAIPAGTEITGSDVEWVSHRADRLRPDAILDPSDLIGFETRRTLRPGEPLRSYDLQRPVAVERGELITLLFEAPGIQLSVRARALEDAADGEMARFVNLQSNRTVEALVDGPGRARVGFSPSATSF
ncbi:flagellar basal body P-ring formation chaperone FlgA [Maricaulis parjimensis]|uniref:flagellar basal body P-ring formation chaperone FlgA n=1 Tax=Maricaulis parjimensis TaxID=144023 RepID=UPI001939EDB1|nr:flagellar basal body P-ring formation chaperone FlgA [Maricaulis parjimensis]